MDLKQRIKARLKSQFPGVNLSNDRLNAIADRLAKTLTDESEDSELDETIQDFNEAFSFAEIAKSDDRKRTLERKKALENKKKNAESEEDEIEKPADDETPSWAKALIESNKTLAAELNAIKQGQIKDSRTAALKKALREAGADEAYIEKSLKSLSKMNFESDEDFQAHISEEIEDAKQFVKTTTERSFSQFGAPIFSKGGKDGVSPETLAYLNEQKEKSGAGPLTGKPIIPQTN